MFKLGRFIFSVFGIAVFSFFDGACVLHACLHHDLLHAFAIRCADNRDVGHRAFDGCFDPYSLFARLDARDITLHSLLLDAKSSVSHLQRGYLGDGGSFGHRFTTDLGIYSDRIRKALDEACAEAGRYSRRVRI